jgi:hypothetical protein
MTKGFNIYLLFFLIEMTEIDQIIIFKPNMHMKSEIKIVEEINMTTIGVEIVRNMIIKIKKIYGIFLIF